MERGGAQRGHYIVRETGTEKRQKKNEKRGEKEESYMTANSTSLYKLTSMLTNP